MATQVCNLDQKNVFVLPGADMERVDIVATRYAQYEMGIDPCVVVLYAKDGASFTNLADETCVWKRLLRADLVENPMYWLVQYDAEQDTWLVRRATEADAT